MSETATDAAIDAAPSEFELRFKVRHTEIDSQQVVHNARYLEYAELIAYAFWEWTGVAQSHPNEWKSLFPHIRRTEIDYLQPFRRGDEISGRMTIERVGTTSLTNRFELRHAGTDVIHVIIIMVSVNVDPATGQTRTISAPLRAFFEDLASREGACG